MNSNSTTGDLSVCHKEPKIYNSTLNVSEIRYPISCLVPLSKKVEFINEKTIEHIFLGSDKGTGFHYEGIEGARGKVKPGTREAPNDKDVYRAQVEFDGKIKKNNRGYSTFFPRNMSPEQVVDAIIEAKQNAIDLGRNRYLGVSKNGLIIEIFTDSKGNINTAFPKNMRITF